MLARQPGQDAHLARRSNLPSAFGPASQLGRPSSSSTSPAGQQSSSLNMKPARVVGTEGTAYVAMCKRVLGRRLLRAFSLAFFASMVIWTSSLSLTGGLSLVPSFANGLRNLATSAVVFLLCVLPTLVLRKLMMTQAELTTTSAVARVRALTVSNSSRTAVLVFTACGGFLAFFWAVVMQLASPTVKLGVFASTAKHPVQLNERHIVVLLSNISLGLVYASRELWCEAFLPQWPRDIVPLQGLILARLARVPASLGLPIVHSVVFSAAYVSLRKPVLRFLLSWFGIIVRPYVATFLRPTHRSMDLGLFGKLVVLELTTVALWEAAKALLDVYMVQPMLISHHSASPTKCLLAGLGAPSAYFRYFAQFELSHLAVASPARRADIFNDISTPSTAWSDIWRAEMVSLGQSYQTLRSRGQASLSGAPPSSAASEGVSNGASDQPAQQHLVPKTDPSIFKHAPKTAYDSLSSGPTQTALPTPAKPPSTPNSSTRQSSTPSTVPAIFTQRAHNAPAPSSAPTRPLLPSSSSTLSTVQAQLAKIWWTVWGGVPAETRTTLEANLAPIREALIREVVRGTTRRPLPHRDLDLLTIQTLSALVSASLAEDPYGQVQRDIPRTLEALTSYLTSLEALYAQLQASSSAPGKWAEEAAVTMTVLKKDVEPVLDAAREGIRQIVDTFREHLPSAFRFPPDVVKVLEQFID